MKADPSANLNPASRAITSAVASSSQFPELSAISFSLSFSLSPLTPPTPLLLTFTLLSSILTRQPITTYTYSLQSLHISQLTASHRHPNPRLRHPDSGLRARGTNIPYSRYNNIIFAALDAVGERAGLFLSANVLRPFFLRLPTYPGLTFNSPHRPLLRMVCARRGTGSD